MVIDVAAGKELQIVQEGKKNAVFIKFIFSKDDLKVLEKIKVKMPEIIYKVSVKEVDTHEITDSSSRFGYYIVVGKNKNELIGMLKQVGVML